MLNSKRREKSKPGVSFQHSIHQKSSSAMGICFGKLKDSESVEDVSQSERNQPKIVSASPDEYIVSVGDDPMVSSYEREEQKYVAEEKDCPERSDNGRVVYDPHYLRNQQSPLLSKDDVDIESLESISKEPTVDSEVRDEFNRRRASGTPTALQDQEFLNVNEASALAASLLSDIEDNIMRINLDQERNGSKTESRRQPLESRVSSNASQDFRDEVHPLHETREDSEPCQSVLTASEVPTAVVSSSSSEFFTVRDDGTARSSADETSRPKSIDSSLQGHVASSVGTSMSDYLTAPNPPSASSSFDGGAGNLSSDETVSETLLPSCLTPDTHALSEPECEEFISPSHLNKNLSKSNQVPESRTGKSEGGNLSTMGLPITLTSSTSGTTVCTQVETTYETRVTGDAELSDDQEGNILNLELTDSTDFNSGTVRHGSECDSSDENIFYKTFEAPNSKSVIGLICAPLADDGGCTNDSNDEPRKSRPTETNVGHTTPPNFLEDIEEESPIMNSSQNSSYKSERNRDELVNVSMCELEDKFGDKAIRPISRESSNSLCEFENLESALLQEFDKKENEPLSEIDEGQESSDWTESSSSIVDTNKGTHALNAKTTDSVSVPSVHK